MQVKWMWNVIQHVDSNYFHTLVEFHLQSMNTLANRFVGTSDAVSPVHAMNVTEHRLVNSLGFSQKWKRWKLESYVVDRCHEAGLLCKVCSDDCVGRRLECYSLGNNQ